MSDDMLKTKEGLTVNEKPRFVYDPDVKTVRDTGVMLDLLQDYAWSKFHENGVQIARLLNEESEREKYKHVKTGGIYTVVSRNAMLEAKPSETYVIYRGTDGKDWIRPQHEFFDGRFEKI